MAILWAAVATRNRYCEVVLVTTPTISDDEEIADFLISIDEEPFKKQVRLTKKFIAKVVAEHITPEKKNPSKYSANEDPYEHNRELGFDFAVEEITKRTKEYLNA